MKNPQKNLATLNIWSRNVTTSTRGPTTRAWISADIWRQDGAICSKNRKIVPYHGSARIPRLTVSVPDYGSCLNAITAGLNVPCDQSCAEFCVLRTYYDNWNVFIKRRLTKLAIGMLDEPWNLIWKDGLCADWSKIWTLNDRRNSNLMIFKISMLKLIKNSCENRLINLRQLSVWIKIDQLRTSHLEHAFSWGVHMKKKPFN